MIENDVKTNLITSYYGYLNIWDWQTQAHRVCVNQRINEKGPSRQRYSFILHKSEMCLYYIEFSNVKGSAQFSMSTGVLNCSAIHLLREVLVYTLYCSHSIYFSLSWVARKLFPRTTKPVISTGGGGAVGQGQISKSWSRRNSGDNEACLVMKYSK